MKTFTAMLSAAGQREQRRAVPCGSGARAPATFPAAEAGYRTRGVRDGTRHQVITVLHRDGRARTVNADTSLDCLRVVAMSHTTNVPLALGAPNWSIAAA